MYGLHRGLEYLSCPGRSDLGLHISGPIVPETPVSGTEFPKLPHDKKGSMRVLLKGSIRVSGLGVRV